MKSIIPITVSLLFLAGCQSTSYTAEEQEVVSNLCTKGDTSGSSASQANFEKSIMDCGGYEIFTDDMLINKTLTFSISKKSKRSMSISKDGTATYYKVNKGSSEVINWALNDKGYLILTFKDGYRWDWVLMKDIGSLFTVKSFGHTKDKTETDLISMAVKVEDSTNE